MEQKRACVPVESKDCSVRLTATVLVNVLTEVEIVCANDVLLIIDNATPVGEVGLERTEPRAMVKFDEPYNDDGCVL